MTELFNLPMTLSPRLAWMKEHGITVLDHGTHLKPGAECELTGKTLYRFQASMTNWSFEKRYGWGDTEVDALVDLAKKAEIKLWNES